MGKKTIYDFTSIPTPLPEKAKRKKNRGFGKLKNQTLKLALENCNEIKYDRKKHTRIKELGYTGIHQLDMLGKKRWIKYFQSGGKVYLIRNSANVEMVNRIIFDKSVSDFVRKGTPLPKEAERKKRTYIKNTPSKVLGFDFYIQTNDKLKKRERKILLLKGSSYFAVYNNNNELDNSLTDIEIVDEWNRFFVQKGYTIPEFESKWIKQFAPKDFESEGEATSVGKIKIPTALKRKRNEVDLDF